MKNTTNERAKPDPIHDPIYDEADDGVFIPNALEWIGLPVDSPLGRWGRD